MPHRTDELLVDSLTTAVERIVKHAEQLARDADAIAERAARSLGPSTGLGTMPVYSRTDVAEQASRLVGAIATYDALLNLAYDAFEPELAQVGASPRRRPL